MMAEEYEKPRVGDYMTKDVVTASPTMTIKAVAKLMKEAKHDGLPVVEADNTIIGMVTIHDLIFQPLEKMVRDVMSREVVVTHPQLFVNDVARAMFRIGINRLPVVDNENKLVGIITNTDVIRSHIERANPDRVRKVKESLQKIHNVEIKVRKGKVRMESLVPTQSRISTEEFVGRRYEIKKGLAEPLVVVKSGDRYILVDGHHRALAAHRVGVDEIDAYILLPSKEIEFGLEKTAEEEGLKTLNDIKVVEDFSHPLTKIVTREEENET